jgi:ATP-dependent DNA helicase RecQ
VPAYTVFHDSTLRELARVRPQSLAELRSISGIGATKLERYGEALLETLALG